MWIHIITENVVCEETKEKLFDSIDIDGSFTRSLFQTHDSALGLQFLLKTELKSPF